MQETPRHPVKTTEKSLQLVEELRQIQPAGVTELSERLDMGPSAVHNHLTTFVKHGYVIQENGLYRLGLKFLEQGGYIRNQMPLFKEGEPEVNGLAEKTGELVNLMSEEMGMGVYIYRAKGSQALDFDTYSGKRTHLHSTGLGKSILAHRPEEEVRAVIDRYGLPKVAANTIEDEDVLFEELELIRERGYAVDDEEFSSGVRCVAAPIAPESRTPIGAISITAPTSRLKGETLEDEFPDLAQSAANVIELNIKYS